MDQSQTQVIQIQVFGAFSITRDGQGLDLERLGGSKPLELLKFLIAYGGRSISADFIISKLWSEADGDHAKISFDGTLLRLRRILGARESLLLKSGTLSLNTSLCGLDLWTFEELAKYVEDAFHLKHISQELAVTLSHSLLSIFRGPCFWLESDVPWVYVLQDKTKNRFLRIVLMLGRTLEANQKFDDAVTLYVTALEYYPLSEEICLRLIETRIHQGLYTEALMVYRQFSHVLGEALGLKPSKAIQQAISIIREE